MKAETSQEIGEYFWIDKSEERDLLFTQYGPEEKNHLLENMFGLLMWRNSVYPKGVPVNCGHGGSMWLCSKCAQQLIKTNHKQP